MIMAIHSNSRLRSSINGVLGCLPEDDAHAEALGRLVDDVYDAEEQQVAFELREIMRDLWTRIGRHGSTTGSSDDAPLRRHMVDAETRLQGLGL